MTNEETTHQNSNGIQSTNPLDFQWPTNHWKSNGPLDIQWGIGNPMGHPHWISNESKNLNCKPMVGFEVAHYFEG